jgi:hypothetical protein
LVEKPIAALSFDEAISLVRINLPYGALRHLHHSSKPNVTKYKEQMDCRLLPAASSRERYGDLPEEGMELNCDWKRGLRAGSLPHEQSGNDQDLKI